MIRDVDAIVVATRHDSHARLAIEALDAGKHVFVEKPLGLTHEELADVEAALSRRASAGAAPVLMVGFNRRFAPHTRRIKALLGGVSGPKALVMTVNAGALPKDHWALDPEAGGGRIVGEACHFIDLLRHLAGAPITSARKAAMTSPSGDTASLTLDFADGSIGTIHYFANGARAFPKERLEVFCAGRVLQLDNFRSLKGFGWPGFSSMRLMAQDKGHDACAAAFMEAVRSGGPAPIAPEELFEVSRAAIALAEA